MRELLFTKFFVLKVYDNGEHEFKEILEGEPINGLENCSQKIKQALMVVEEYHKVIRDNFDPQKGYTENAGKRLTVAAYYAAYTSAINATANRLNVDISTVRDKLERQLSKTSDDMKVLFYEYYISTDVTETSELEKILLENIGIRKETEDDYAIRRFFKQMRDEKYDIAVNTK